MSLKWLSLGGDVFDEDGGRHSPHHTKQYGSEDVLAPLVADACLGTVSAGDSSRGRVHVDSVRVVKILGGSVDRSHVVRGYVAQRGVETSRTARTDARIAVYGCGFEASATESRGTVLMKNAEDLRSYNRSEETKMDEIVKSIVDAGVNVVVCGGSVSEMAVHFLQRYDVLCLKIGSKWELRRLCAAVNATALVRLGPPLPDLIGSCDDVRVMEVGGRKITVFRNDAASCRLSTLVLRASTSGLLQRSHERITLRSRIPILE